MKEKAKEASTVLKYTQDSGKSVTYKDYVLDSESDYWSENKHVHSVAMLTTLATVLFE